jgi:hypothetical protein
MPNNDRFFFFLENGILTILLSFYLYFLIATRMIPVLYRIKKLPQDYDAIKFNSYYLYILYGFTLIYIISYVSLFIDVKNKMLYLKYFIKHSIQYFALLTLNMMLALVMPLPFGQMYLFLWSKHTQQHRNLLIKINMDGEM